MIRNYLLYDGVDIFQITSETGKTRNETHQNLIKTLNKHGNGINPIKPYEVELVIPQPDEIRYLRVNFSSDYQKMVEIAPIENTDAKINLGVSNSIADFITFIGETQFITKVTVSESESELEDNLFKEIKNGLTHRKILKENFNKITVPKGRTIIAIQSIISGDLLK